MNTGAEIFGNIVLYFLFGLICGFYAGYVAESKHRGVWAWFFGGLFFNIIALIAIAGMMPKQE